MSATDEFAKMRAVMRASESTGKAGWIQNSRIPIESDHLFRSNPIADSGVSDHLAGVGVS